MAARTGERLEIDALQEPHLVNLGAELKKLHPFRVRQLCMQLVEKFIIHLHWTIIIYRVVPHEPTRRGPL